MFPSAGELNREPGASDRHPSGGGEEHERRGWRGSLRSGPVGEACRGDVLSCDACVLCGPRPGSSRQPGLQPLGPREGETSGRMAEGYGGCGQCRWQKEGPCVRGQRQSPARADLRRRKSRPGSHLHGHGSACRALSSCLIIRGLQTQVGGHVFGAMPPRSGVNGPVLDSRTVTRFGH